MLYHDVKLPKFIEVFAVGKPEFQTSLAVTISGREARQGDREEALQKYKIKNCVLSEEQFHEFNSFFRARRGQLYAFKFKDYADYKASKQYILTGSNDDKRTRIALSKLYKDPVASYLRRITKLVPGSVKLYLNGLEFETGIDYEKGLVILPRPLKIEETLIGEFEFDVAVRFLSDSFEYMLRPDGAIEIADMELIEVIE